MSDSVHVAGILMAYSVVAIGALSPGAAVIAIMGAALERGRRPAVFLAGGVVCGSLFWGIMAAAGLSALLARYGTVLIVLKIAGGLYLLWLASRALRAAFADAPPMRPAAPDADGNRKMWLSGLLIHLTNPKGVFGWLATVALGMTPESPVWVAVAIVAGGVTISAICHVGYALLFSTPRAARLYARARRGIQLAFAAVFGTAGLRLLLARA